MMQFNSNSRNRASAAWDFSPDARIKAEREGMYFVAVDLRNTTKEYASCGVNINQS